MDSLSLPDSLPETEFLRLYQIAKSRSWDINRDLDWHSFAVDKNFPFNPQANRFSGYAEYEALPCEQQTEIAWQQHAQDICDILCGEQAALTISAQLLSDLDNSAARLFLASQVFDEARHVEFYSRYLRAITAEPVAPAKELLLFARQATAIRDIDTKLLACQGVLESLAMVRFRRLRRETRVPLLRKALTYIAQDEARHTTFGAAYLASRYSKLDKSGKQARVEVLQRLAQQLGDNPQRYLGIASRWGFDTHRLLAHLRRQRSLDRAARTQLRNQQQLNLRRMGLPASRLGQG